MFRASSVHLQEDTVVHVAAYSTVTVYELCDAKNSHKE